MKLGTIFAALIFAVRLVAQKESRAGNTPKYVACLTRSLKTVDADLNS